MPRRTAVVVLSSVCTQNGVSTAASCCINNSLLCKTNKCSRCQQYMCFHTQSTKNATCFDITRYIYIVKGCKKLPEDDLKKIEICFDGLHGAIYVLVTNI